MAGDGDTSSSSPGLRVDLEERVALVTGSSRGLGAATAARLAAMGTIPVVTYHAAEAEAGAVADKIRADGGRCFAYQLDMGNTASIEALFDWLEGVDGPGALDILVANAAAISFKPLLAVKPHNVEKTFAISVTGFLTAVQRAVLLMQVRGRGRIVAISGGDTRQYGPVHGLLAAAKASMETLVRYLQIELHGTGVTAIGVNPYAFRGDSVAMQFGAVYERLMRTLDAVHPRGAISETDNVAEVVARALPRGSGFDIAPTYRTWIQERSLNFLSSAFNSGVISLVSPRVLFVYDADGTNTNTLIKHRESFSEIKTLELQFAPEPGAVALIASGVLGLAGLARMRRRG